MVFSAGGKKGDRGRNKWVVAFIFQACDKVSDQFGLLPSGGWAGLQWEATWPWIQRHLRELPQAVLSSTQHHSLLAALWTACKNTANTHVDKYQTFPQKPYELFLLVLLSVSIIDGKRGYLLITKHHIQRSGLFEWLYSCAGLTVGSHAPSVGWRFSFLRH